MYYNCVRHRACIHTIDIKKVYLYRIFIHAFIDRSNYYESGYNECVHYYHKMTMR